MYRALSYECRYDRWFKEKVQWNRMYFMCEMYQWMSDESIKTNIFSKEKKRETNSFELKNRKRESDFSFLFLKNNLIFCIIVL